MKTNLTELDHLLAQQRRGILRDHNLQKKLKRLLIGRDGEHKVVALLKKYLPSHFKILCNVWLEVDGVLTEIDILVVTAYFWWVIEVKNYEGHFEYRNSCCFINQRQIPDQIAAFRNRLRIVNRVADKMSKGQPVVMASMVFTNELCRVTAEPQPDFKLLMNYQFVWQIQEMVELYHEALTHIDVGNSLKLIESFRTDSPYLPSVLPAESLLDLKAGVYCPTCFSYQMSVKKRSYTCLTCLHSISKSEGILRIACELGVLYFDNPKIITTKNIFYLIDNTVSQKMISETLRLNLTPKSKARNTYYTNYAIPYDAWLKIRSE